MFSFPFRQDDGNATRALPPCNRRRPGHPPRTCRMPVRKRVSSRRSEQRWPDGRAPSRRGLVTLTALQYDFLLGIGWRPLEDPLRRVAERAFLGPYGWPRTSTSPSRGRCSQSSPSDSTGITEARDPAPPSVRRWRRDGAARFRDGPYGSRRSAHLHGSVHDRRYSSSSSPRPGPLFALRGCARIPAGAATRVYTLATALIASACLVLQARVLTCSSPRVLAWFEVPAVKLWRTEAPSTRFGMTVWRRDPIRQPYRGRQPRASSRPLTLSRFPFATVLTRQHGAIVTRDRRTP